VNENEEYDPKKCEIALETNENTGSPEISEELRKNFWKRTGGMEWDFED
jgi:hypothetical protein